MLLLEIQNLRVRYSHALVLENVSLKVRATECVGVIGPNGAGKTTLLRCISGIKDFEGGISFNGQNLRNFSSSAIVRLGIVQAPEGRHLFPHLNVRENLQLGAFLTKDPKQVAASFQYVMNLFPHLRERLEQFAGTLSGGEQQMVTIGRAIMSSPRLLMLDEPSFGLGPLVKETIADSIKEIQKSGVTILLVEQDAQMAFDLAQQVNVLEEGQISVRGPSAELSEDPRIKSSYLGIS
jgi:branched-chain amino acid transport system ATP-binding protein